MIATMFSKIDQFAAHKNNENIINTNSSFYYFLNSIFFAVKFHIFVNKKPHSALITDKNYFFEFIRFHAYKYVFAILKFFFLQQNLKKRNKLFYSSKLKIKRHRLGELRHNQNCFFDETTDLTAYVLLKKGLGQYNFFIKATENILTKDTRKISTSDYVNLMFPTKIEDPLKSSEQRFYDEHNSMTRNKLSINSLFSSEVSEFLQTKGFFDTNACRIKNFSDLWDESRWMIKILQAEKEKNKTMYDEILQIKNKKNLVNLIDEIYIFLIFLQTNESDFCHKCLENKEFFSNFFVNFEQKKNFFWTIFNLNNIWTKQLSKKLERKHLIAFSFLTSDQAINDFVTIRKMNSNNEFYSGKFFFKSSFSLSYLSNSKIQIISDNFLFSQIINPFFSSVDRSIDKISICKNFLFVRKHSRVANGLYNFTSDPKILWSKHADSFFIISIEKVLRNFFCLAKKINYDNKFRQIICCLLFKILSSHPEQKNLIKLKEREKSYFKKFPIWYIFYKDRFIHPTKKRVSKLSSEIFFSKKPYFWFCEKIFEKCAIVHNTAGKLFILKGAFHILSCNFYFEFYEKAKEKVDDIEIEQNFAKFSSLFDINALEQSLRPHSKTICFDNFLYITTLKNHFHVSGKSATQCCFFVGVRLNTEEKISFTLSATKTFLVHLVFFLCAKYRLKNIFIMNSLSSAIDVGRSLEVFSKFSELDAYASYSDSVVDLDFESYYKFKQNIQISHIKKNSLIVRLIDTLFIQSISKNEAENLQNSIYIVMKLGQFAHLISVWQNTSDIFFNEITCSLYSKLMIRNVIFFCLKQFFSHSHIHHDKLFKSHQRKLFLPFNCGLGPRKSSQILYLINQFACQNDFIIAEQNNSYYWSQKFSSASFFKSLANFVQKKSENYYALSYIKLQLLKNNNFLENDCKDNSENNNSQLEHFDKNRNRYQILIKNYDGIFLHENRYPQFVVRPITKHFRPSNTTITELLYLCGTLNNGVEFLIHINQFSQYSLTFRKLLSSLFTTHPLKIVRSNLETIDCLGSMIVSDSFESYQKYRMNNEIFKKFSNILNLDTQNFFCSVNHSVTRKNDRYQKKLCLGSFFMKVVHKFKISLIKNANFTHVLNYNQKPSDTIKTLYSRKFIEESMNIYNNWLTEYLMILLPPKLLFKRVKEWQCDIDQKQLNNILFQKKLKIFISQIKKFSIIISFVLDKHVCIYASFLVRIDFSKSKTRLVYKFDDVKRYFFNLRLLSIKVEKRLQYYFSLAKKHKNFVANGEENIEILLKNKKKQNNSQYFFFHFFISKTPKENFGIIFGNYYTHFQNFFNLNYFGYKFHNKIFSSIDDLKIFLIFIVNTR